MTLPILPFTLPGFRIEGVSLNGTTAVIEACSLQSTPPCPRCSNDARRVHSRYLRFPRDLPWGAYAIRLKLHVRRDMSPINWSSRNVRIL
ncbi:MAG: transposase family protein [Chloroflexota bacterium]|nr:transposase family protein [Chloroflexota bacterium]